MDAQAGRKNQASRENGAQQLPSASRSASDAAGRCRVKAPRFALGSLALAAAILLVLLLMTHLGLQGFQLPMWPALLSILLSCCCVSFFLRPATIPEGEAAQAGAHCAGAHGSTKSAGQDDLRQAQKMEAIGRLAGGVAHDFNNLLTVINGYCEILLDLVRDEAQIRDMIREVHKAGQRAATLTRQLLAFGRKQMLQPRLVNMNALLQNLNTMLRRLIGENIDLVTNLHPGALPVNLDPGQMEQALINLVINARDAMPKGGRVTLTTSRLDADNRQVVVSVTDTGCGMSEEVRGHLFEPFFTTKELGKGTGLGLSMVYGIVQQSGGHIDVLSAPGRGTTFKIHFPLLEEQPTAEAWTAPVKEDLAGTETILMVEDEGGIRKLVCQALQQQGYTVLEAGDGVEALNICKQYKGPMHLVVTDVVMPMLSGVDLVAHLTRRYPAIKSLFISGYTDSAVVREGVQDMTIHYLNKPFVPEELLARIRALLDEKELANAC